MASLWRQPVGLDVIRLASRGSLPPASPTPTTGWGGPIGTVWGYLRYYSIRLGIPALHPHFSQVRRGSHPFPFSILRVAALGSTTRILRARILLRRPINLSHPHDHEAVLIQR